MNVFDVIIVLVILFGTYIGFRRGVITQTVSFLGIIVITVIAYYTKDWLAGIFCKWLPFINFNLGVVKSVQTLNILFYELIAFIIIFSVLFALFKIVLKTTEIFEAILKGTIILALPLKILGAIVGFFQYTFILALVLLVLMSPIVNLQLVKESKLATKVIEITNVPFLPLSGLIKTINEMRDLEDINLTAKRDNAELKTLDVLLKNKITNVKLVEDLINSGKIKIEDTGSILNKYKE